MRPNKRKKMRVRREAMSGCPYCDKRFVNTTAMWQHIRSFHRKRLEREKRDREEGPYQP